MEGLKAKAKITHNGQVSLQVGYFYIRPAGNRCPIENIKLKLTTKAKLKLVCPN
jgi:hypothetical protein